MVDPAVELIRRGVVVAKPAVIVRGGFGSGAINTLGAG
jgi:hypothetical protein